MLILLTVWLFSLTLCDIVIPSQALEINTTCASSFFTDEWSDQDALSFQKLRSLMFIFTWAILEGLLNRMPSLRLLYEQRHLVGIMTPNIL